MARAPLALVALADRHGTHEGNAGDGGGNRKSRVGVVAGRGNGGLGLLLRRLLGVLAGLARLGLGRLGRRLVLLPLGVERHGSIKLDLIARGIARAGAVRSGVPALEGIAIANGLDGDDLSLGYALDGGKIGGLFVLGAVQIVGEVEGVLLGRAFLVAAVIAGLGCLASPSAGVVRSPLSVGGIEGVVVLPSV